ncbi:pyridoxamine 5-phosphate oxidase, partial [Vibrio anguillarum]|nr:pyridoxamine 5-phosphate oxidase [Vibrio anguillarum]
EMSGALGIEQLKKLPKFIKTRRENAKLFQNLFENHPYLQIQKETGKSSWFGFSLIIKPNAPYSRKELVKLLTANGIECRPIVTGNFLKNKEVLEYFDYEVSGSLESAEYLDEHGLFVGNQQNEIE